MKRSVSAFLLCVTTVNACYRSVPVEASALSVGALVSVDLNVRGSANLISRLGNNIDVLDGTVMSSDGQSLTLALAAIRRRGELHPSIWAGEPVTLALSDVEAINGRVLSRSRTTMAAVALGAAGVALVIGIAKAAGIASGGGGERPIPTP